MAAPTKISVPFGQDDATKTNPIPVPSQIGITPGAASFDDGFPPLCATPLISGGIPPSKADMNGVLYMSTALNAWYSQGGSFVFDGSYATAIGGYPVGARLLRSDGNGFWLNTAAANSTAPESSGAAAAGWVPDWTNGIANVSVTTADVTLNELQYGFPIIVCSGILTGNRNLIFPAVVGQWLVVNHCTGAYTLTTKTATGTGVVVSQGIASNIYGDATNIYATEATAGITALTGDVTASGPGSATATLATVNSNIGSFLGSITVNAKGLVTAASNLAFTGLSGYQTLPSGLMLQWMDSGSVPNDTATAINLPVHFPHACLTAVAIDNFGTGTSATWSVTAYSTATVTVRPDGNTASCNIIAIGY